MTETAIVLTLLGFNRSAFLHSYLTLRNYTRVLNLKTLIAHTTPAYLMKEYPGSTEFFVKVTDQYLHLKYDKLDTLMMAGLVKEQHDLRQV